MMLGLIVKVSTT